MFIRVEQAPVSAHLTLTSLIATHLIIGSRKRPAPVPFTALILKLAAPVTNNFFSSPGCPLTRASTVENIVLGFKAEENDNENEKDNHNHNDNDNDNDNENENDNDNHNDNDNDNGNIEMNY